MVGGSSKLVFALAACGGVVVLALWSTMGSDAADVPAATKDDVTAAPAAEPVARTNAVGLAAVDETGSARRPADKPEIVGTLIDTATGLPLAGYTIELRPRARSRTFRWRGQELVSSAAKAANTRIDAGANLFFPNQVLPVSPTIVDAGDPMHEAAVAILNRFHSEPVVPPVQLEVVLERAATVLHSQDFQLRVRPPVTLPQVEAAPEQPQDPEATAPAPASSEAPRAEPAQQAASPELSQATAPPAVIESLFVQFRERSAWTALPVLGASGGEGRFQPQSLFTLTNPDDRTRFAQRRLQLPQLSFVNAFAPELEAREPVRATTDASGVFRFDCPGGEPEEKGVVLVLVPHARDWFPSTTYTALDPERMCLDEIVWRVERCDGAALSGRVADAHTLTPIAGLTLELSGERGARTELETDEEGRFAMTSSFPAGRVELSAHDGDARATVAVEPREARVPDRKHAEEELLVLASMGPTWRMRFQTLESVQVGGEETPNAQEFPADEVELRLLGAQPIAFAADEVNPFAEWRALRAGDPGWVRYPRAVEWSRSGARVEFRSQSREWAGTSSIRPVAALTDLEGATIVLRRTASVTGVVKLAQGDHGDLDARGLRVRACRSARDAGSTYDFAFCEQDGSFTLEGLDAHAVHALVLTRGDVVVHVVELALQPGEERTLEIEL